MPDIQDNSNQDAKPKVNQPKPSMKTKVWNWIKRAWTAIYPGPLAWKGASAGILFAALFTYSFILFQIFSVASPNSAAFALAIYLLALAFVGGAFIMWIFQLIKYVPNFLPKTYQWILFTSIIILTEMSLRGVDDSAKGSVVALIITAFSLLGAGISVLAFGGLHDATILRRSIAIGGGILGLIAVGYGMFWYWTPGKLIEPPVNAAAQANGKIDLLTLPDPSQPGIYTVKTLTYGSGEDQKRPEYGEHAAIKTKPVDGSALVERWKGKAGDIRTEYWGFDDEALPLNGRAWYPDGNGPFPLVLIVHGNHQMEDYSDPGYDYLGELLASRGFILVSVDENFLNLTITDIASYFKNKWTGIDFNASLKEENDLRAWLLLEHLKVWRDWNQTMDSPFHQKVDMENIAVMGHSRGGEAAAIAACFNRLPAYPDDGNVQFDFNFNIKSVVAIAPVDGQYKPTRKGTPLENVNYFVLHGSHDGDMTSFHGSIQYDRVDFADEHDWFKSYLYIYGANPGQFNTSWGIFDNAGFGARFLNTRNIMPAEEQQQIAKVYISAFLEATLKDQKGYIRLFRDYRVGEHWLPDSIYLNQFEDSTYEFFCTFEDDINLLTTELTGGHISGASLTVWKEKKVNIKWGSRESNAVYLGWYNKKENGKSSNVSNVSETVEVSEQSNAAGHEILDAIQPIASYTIVLPENGPSLSNNSVLVFSLADAKESAKPKDKGKDEDNDKDKVKEERSADNNNAGGEEETTEVSDATDMSGSNTDQAQEPVEDSKEREGDEDKDKEEKEEKKKPIDFTIEVTDHFGESTSLPLSHFSYLQPQLEAEIKKHKSFDSTGLSEVVFQSFEFPLSDFVEGNTEFNPGQLQTIRFLFDRSEEGVVILDDLGFREE